MNDVGLPESVVRAAVFVTVTISPAWLLATQSYNFVKVQTVMPLSDGMLYLVKKLGVFKIESISLFYSFLEQQNIIRKRITRKVITTSGMSFVNDSFK